MKKFPVPNRNFVIPGAGKSMLNLMFFIVGNLKLLIVLIKKDTFYNNCLDVLPTNLNLV